MEEIFPFGRPVTGEHLVGRESLVEELISLVKNNQSAMLVAPRRYGKTSLLLEVMRRLKDEGWYVGNVDFFDIPTLDKLAEKIVKTTIENKFISADKIISAARKGIMALRESMEIKQVTQNGMEIILSFPEAEKDIDALLDECLDFPEHFAAKQKARMCFIYDELGDISKMNAALIKKMRSKFQMHKKTVYLFSGSQESVMRDIFVDKKGAFYGFCRVFELGAVPAEPFKHYIIRTFDRAHITISSDDADGSLDQTQGHPYYTQYVCQTIYLNVKEKRNVETCDIKDGFEQALVSQQTYLDSLRASLKHDSILQLRLCAFLAKDEQRSVYSQFDDNRQNIYSALQSLIKKGMIRKTDNRYTLTDPFFKKYLRRIEL